MKQYMAFYMHQLVVAAPQLRTLLRSLHWEGEGVLITCASRSLSRLLSIPIVGATYDWGDVTPRFTSTNKELGRQSRGFQMIQD